MKRVFFIFLFTIGATFSFMAIMRELNLPDVVTGVGFGMCLLNILMAFDIIVNDWR